MTTPPPKRNPIQTWRAPSKQSPAQINVSRIFAEPQQFAPSTSATSVLESKLPPPAELLEASQESRGQKRERDTSPLNQAVAAVAAGADDAASRQRGSPASAPPLERQHSNHSNKRVKRSADVDVPESTDGTIRRSNPVLAGGWFGQRGRPRPPPPRPKSVFERQQNTTSVQLQSSEISQPTPASTPSAQAPQTPSLQPASNTTHVASGSPATPIAIPIKAATNHNDTPSSSPSHGRWFGSLLRTTPQPAKVLEPQPPNISELVSESTKPDPDPPTTPPVPQVPSPASSKPPTRTGWFSKSVTSSPTPVQQPLPDQLIPPSPTSSLRVIEAPSTSSSAEPVPATITVNNAASRYMLNIPLLGRSKVKVQEVVVVEDLGTRFCSVSIYSTNIAFSTTRHRRTTDSVVTFESTVHDSERTRSFVCSHRVVGVHRPWTWC